MIATFIVAVICKGQQYPPIFWRSICESALNTADALDNSVPFAVLFSADLQQTLQFRCFWLFKLLLLSPVLLYMRHTLPPLLSRYLASLRGGASTPPASEPAAAAPQGSSDAATEAPIPAPCSTSTSSSSDSSAVHPQLHAGSTLWDRAAQTSRDAVATTTGAAAALLTSAWSSGAAAVGAAGSAALGCLPDTSRQQVQAAVEQLSAARATAVAALVAAAVRWSGPMLQVLERLQGTQPQPGTTVALMVAAVGTLAACLGTPFVEPFPDAQDPSGLSSMVFSLVKIASLVLELSVLKLLASQCWQVARRAATTTTLLSALRQLSVLACWRAAVEAAWAAGIGLQLLCGITSGWKIVAAACSVFVAWNVRRMTTENMAALPSRGTLWALTIAAMVVSYPVCLPPLDILPDLPIITEGSSHIWMGLGA